MPFLVEEVQVALSELIGDKALGLVLLSGTIAGV